MTNSPHYLLFSEASCDEQASSAWRFVLQNLDSEQRFAVSDVEPEAGAERLELLAVVRGLEALNGPARVTLVTKSRYVSRGIKQGIPDWRANEWHWERFGRLVPVRDHDLWQRVDRALLFHEVNCQAWQFDDGNSNTQDTAFAMAQPGADVNAAQAEPARAGTDKGSIGPGRERRAAATACREPVASRDASGRSFRPSRRQELDSRRGNPRRQTSRSGPSLWDRLTLAARVLVHPTRQRLHGVT